MNLPESFIARTSQLMGEDACMELCHALEKDSPVSIRMNLSKMDAVPASARRIPWTTSGYYLDNRPTFTFDPLFHAGCYYVQEASSMFVSQVVREYVKEPVVALDLCAAPGGKSTLLRSLLPDGSFLIANEVMRNRSQVLAENIVKWGHPDVMVTSNDPSEFSSLRSLFDLILTDVPCSGEGMFRKDPVAVEEWSPENVGLCWERQRRILRDIWPCLKPGGILIYSTCTYNREENEDNVAWIANELGADILSVPTQPEWNITNNLTGTDFPVYRFLPHKTEGEGLFLAVLRKKAPADGSAEESADDFVLKDMAGKGKKNKKAKGADKSRGTDKGKGVERSKGAVKPLTFPTELKDALSLDGDEYDFWLEDGIARAIRSKWHGLYDLVKSQLTILHAGILLAEQKGKDWQPHHSLAMSSLLKRGYFPESELTYEQAIAYLRKEAVTLDQDVERGYVLLTFGGKALGFAKNIGNRANNLYPQEWRIRSGYLPETIKMVF